MGSGSRLPPCLPEQGASRFQASLGDLGNPEANKSGMLSDGKQFRPRLRSSVTIDRNVNPRNIPFFMTPVGEPFKGRTAILLIRRKKTRDSTTYEAPLFLRL